MGSLVHGALAFTVELGLLAGVFRGALAAGRLVGLSGAAVWGVAGAAGAALVLLWAVLAAPASPRRLQGPWIAGVKAALYLTGALGWALAGPGWAAWTFAAAAMVSLALGLALNAP